jgi:hypothetical protein
MIHGSVCMSGARRVRHCHEAEKKQNGENQQGANE